MSGTSRTGLCSVRLRRPGGVVHVVFCSFVRMLAWLVSSRWAASRRLPYGARHPRAWHHTGRRLPLSRPVQQTGTYELVASTVCAAAAAATAAVAAPAVFPLLLARPQAGGAASRTRESACAVRHTRVGWLSLHTPGTIITGRRQNCSLLWILSQ